MLTDHLQSDRPNTTAEIANCFGKEEWQSAFPHGWL